MNEGLVAELWRRVHGGDDGAWAELERHMRGVLYRQAFKVTIPGMELSDRVQEARIGLWLACLRDGPERAEHVVAWLSRRVRYYLLDRLKEQCVQLRQEDGHVRWELNPAKSPLAWDEGMAPVPSERASVERHAVEAAWVSELIREVGARYHQGEEVLSRLVAMHGQDDRGLKGIASDIGVAEASLWQRMTRMRAAMIQAMIRRLAEEDRRPEEWMVTVLAHQAEVMERMNRRARASYHRRKGERSHGLGSDL